MFSPEASIVSTRGSLRNPRRRQRNSEGPQQQQPRRKRSKLSDDTHQSPSDAQHNGNGRVMMNGHASHGSAEKSPVLLDMPVREKKAAMKRALEKDMPKTLTKNENYSVRMVSCFPEILLQRSTPFRASALPSAGFALALTSHHALVWNYIGGPNKAITLTLPPGLRDSDPLPLGAIVRNGPTNDFGVVAIAPSIGKIVFWENVDNAEAQSHFSHRQIVTEGSMKLYSGERVTGLVDIDHAGYVLTFSSGRSAQLTLRDSQGRPSITVTALSAPTASGGSFFSFKGLLGGAIRKSIASVKARPSESRGQMEVIMATKHGVFQLWDLSWSGQQIFKREVDVHANILSAAQRLTAPETQSQQDVHILDFTIMDRQNAPTISLWVLVALSGRHALDYSLLELDLADSTNTVSRAIPLRNYHHAKLSHEPAGILLLPPPGHTAFVQFSDAIVVASLSEPEESPEAQLFSDSGRTILPFQDVVYLKEDAHARVVGHALIETDQKDRRSSALLFVHGYGMIQISAAPPPRDEEEESRRKVTAFSKLVQATLYSELPGNIIDFSTKSRYSFGQAEIEKAALSISQKILSSSLHAEKSNLSMEEQFRDRTAALHTLIVYLQEEYPPISFVGRWQLLWHAEKLAAAHQLWKWYQSKLQDQQARPEAYPENVLMDDIVKALHEKYKTKPDPAKGETDRVRFFFMKDVDSLGILLPWSWNFLRLFYINNGDKSRESVLQRLSEANDVMLNAFETAFSFRQTNIELYGLEADSLHDGILKPGHGYDMLPQFWTSSHNIVSSIRSLIDVGRNLAEDSFEQGVQEDVAQKLGKDNPRMVKIGCQNHIERFQWALEQSDEKKREMGRALREEWNREVRPQQITGLMRIGLASEAMNLAEQYRDMPTLVKLIWEEMTYLESNKASSQSKMEQAEINVKLTRIRERILRNFEIYGDEWAEAYYMNHITEGQSSLLFSKEYLNPVALTKFLRADPSRARLQWICNVGFHDFGGAAGALYKTATRQETNTWCHKVELSLAKLALLARDEKQSKLSSEQSPEEQNVLAKEKQTRDYAFKNTSDRLEYANIQEYVYGLLLPIVTGALDDESAIQLLMAEYGQGRLTERPALQSLLQQGFEQLVHHRVIEPALLVDVLTLMSSDEPVDELDFDQPNEFVLALRVMVYCWENLHHIERQGLCALIWKRLCIKDNWAEINATKDAADPSAGDFLARTHVGRTFGGFMKMYEEDDAFGKVWPQPFEKLYGAGCTDGELCIRFPSEDLRRPVIRDNALDEAIMKTYDDEHRLTYWFQLACKAGKMALDTSKGDGEQQQQPMIVFADSDDSGSVPGHDGAPENAAAVTSSAFDVDDEHSRAEEHDVDMQDS